MDYYSILGVPKDAKPKEIKDAYRKLVLKYHPDINPSPDATARMQEINSAYSMIGDPKKRIEYDSVYYTTSNSSNSSSYTYKEPNNYNYTINSAELWRDLFENLDRYTQHMDNNSDDAAKIKSKALAFILIDGVTLLFDWLKNK